MDLLFRYGIQAQAAGLEYTNATGGDTIGTYISNGKAYRYHQFYSSGTFTVTKAGEGDLGLIEYLIIGGAGGDGGSRGGGGGGGGYRSSVVGELSGANTAALPRVQVTATSYPIVVGLGGSTNQNGQSSSAFGITALGGGGGGAYTQQGGQGGTGGGSGSPSGNGCIGGIGGTSGQGFGGGRGCTSTSNFIYTGGGGGGAGGSGGNANTNPASGGYGGTGLPSSITGFQVYRAAGQSKGSLGTPPLGVNGEGSAPSNPGTVIIRYEIDPAEVIAETYELLYDSETAGVSFPTTQIDITGLNITKDDELRLVWTTVGNITAIQLYVNDINTDASYTVERLEGESSSLSAARFNVPRIGEGIRSFGVTDIKVSNNSRLVWQSSATRNIGSSVSSIMYQQFNGVLTSQTLSSITKLSLKAAANQFATGSRIRLYKVNTGAA
jgi:hypothetical protein